MWGFALTRCMRPGVFLKLSEVGTRMGVPLLLLFSAENRREGLADIGGWVAKHLGTERKRSAGKIVRGCCIFLKD